MPCLVSTGCIQNCCCALRVGGVRGAKKRGTQHDATRLYFDVLSTQRPHGYLEHVMRANGTDVVGRADPGGLIYRQSLFRALTLGGLFL